MQVVTKARAGLVWRARASKNRARFNPLFIRVFKKAVTRLKLGKTVTTSAREVIA